MKNLAKDAKTPKLPKHFGQHSFGFINVIEFFLISMKGVNVPILGQNFDNIH